MFLVKSMPFKRNANAVFTILILSLFVIPAKAQFLLDGFPAEKNKTTLALNTGYSGFGQYYAAPGKVGIGRKTAIVGLYGSYHLNDYIKFAASVPYLNVLGRDNQGLQDAFVQLQIMPYAKNGFQFYVLSGYGIPLSDYSTESAYSIGQQAEILSFGGGLQYTDKNYFSSFSYQFQNKSAPTPIAHQSQVRLGYFQGPYFFAFNYDLQSSDGGSDYRDGTSRPFTTLGTGYHKLGLTAYKRLSDHWGVSANLSQVVAGRNVGQATDFFIGIIWNN